MAMRTRVLLARCLQTHGMPKMRSPSAPRLLLCRPPPFPVDKSLPRQMLLRPCLPAWQGHAAAPDQRMMSSFRVAGDLARHSSWYAV